jgi:thermostable 8-oxoguanine DNA glycosylase
MAKINYPVTGTRKFKYRTAILKDGLTDVQREEILNKFAGYGYRTAHMVRGVGEVLVTFVRRTRRPRSA